MKKKKSNWKIINIVLLVVSVLVLVLGVHGLYVHLNMLSYLDDTYISSGNALQDMFSSLLGNSMYKPKLFGLITMPWIFEDIVGKIDEWSFQSWFMPILFTALGVFLFLKRRGISYFIANSFRRF